jgi:DNA-binding CsgD family transcriptional regulator
VASEAERRGEDALRTGDWKSARSELGRALASAETPAALDGMARALWWLADVEAAVAYRARAFTAYRRAEDLDTAARIAWWIVREYATVLANPAGANGWLTRGQRLLDSAPPGPGHGWLELARAQRSTDRATQLRYAESAYTLARQFDDPDLEIYSLAQQGLARIASGQVTQGITDLDEAMAAAAEATHLETLGDTLCMVMEAAELVGHADRFEQWTRALDAYMTQHHHIPLYAFCFTCCGEVSAGAGQWEQADGWFTNAIQELEKSGHRSRCAHPVSRLAQLRIQQGHLEEAEGLLSAYRDLPEAVEPLATLLLAQGQPAAASRLLERRLAQLGEANLPAVPLLSLLVQARTAESDADGAHRAAQRLAEMADVSDLDRVRGLATLAAGRVARSEHRREEAQSHLEDALAAFERATRPMEAATVHRELARLWAESRPEVAIEEARAALHGFEQVGARREADETAALLRSLGVRGQTGPKQLGQLSQREREVLELVAVGLTNAEIAARLFISTKTAGNHVSNVLMKLGVRSRTEAAALALRHLPGPG